MNRPGIAGGPDSREDGAIEAKKKTSNKFSPEVRARAVWMVQERQGDHASQWAAIASIADTAAMLFWAMLVAGQITMRKVVGWQSLAERPSDQPIDLAA